MSVQILSVALDDETIDRLARRVTEIMQHGSFPPPQSATQSNPPSSQNPQGAERSGFQPEGRAPESDGPWTDNAPPQTTQVATGGNSTAPSNAGQDGPPTCKCGQPKKWVPPGFSKNTGKSYQGFWACPQPRGNQCPRD